MNEQCQWISAAPSYRADWSAAHNVVKPINYSIWPKENFCESVAVIRYNTTRL